MWDVYLFKINDNLPKLMIEYTPVKILNFKRIKKTEHKSTNLKMALVVF